MAHALNAEVSEDEKLLCAKQLHIDAGLDPRQQVSFTNVSSFKKQLNVKIVIFHHTAGRKQLQCFKTHDTPQPQTIYMYLHDGPYYVIESTTGFFGVSYFCNYCYSTYQTPLCHTCRFRCNVCFTLCQNYPSQTVKCADCKRVCKSQHCYHQHKLVEPVHNLIPCDRMKYCETWYGIQEVRQIRTQMCPKCMYTLWRTPGRHWHESRVFSSAC